MDIQRKPPNRTRKRLLIGTVSLAAIVLATVKLSRLKPAAPTVEKATVWIDTVKRGPMLREVRGTGTLVPERIRWVSASSQGRVERLLVQPGAAVGAETVLLEMSNPELDLSARDAESQLRAAEAETESLRVRLASQLLDQKAAAAAVAANYSEAKLQAETNEQLGRDGLVSSLTLKISRVRVEELATRNALENERLKGNQASIDAQLAAQKARVDQLRALASLRRSEVTALRVKAGAAGVLQVLPVQVGQLVTPGTNLARVAQPEFLKAELRIAETQAKDIQLEQPATIDTRNGLVAGKVSRIDPSVQNGTVTVDVAMTGPLPKGARPDLTVDGTIELERLTNVLYVGRPAYGTAGGSVGLFKLVDEGKEAVRASVKLGRTSVHTVEILEGLAEGDSVVLSDMSAWDSHDRVRLK